MTTEVKFEQLLEPAKSDAAFKPKLLHNPEAVTTKELGANIIENVELLSVVTGCIGRFENHDSPPILRICVPINSSIFCKV